MKYLLTVWLDKPLNGKDSDKVLLEEDVSVNMFDFFQGKCSMTFPMIGDITIDRVKAYSVVFVKKGSIVIPKEKIEKWSVAQAVTH